MAEKVAIIGAGAWGTTLARHLAKLGHEVTLWCHAPEVADEINEEHENIQFLPQIRLPENITATASKEVAVGAGTSPPRLLIWVTPSQYYEATVTAFLPLLQEEVLHLSATKGIARESLKSLSQRLTDCLPASHHPHIAVLSGPNLAREIAQDLPAATTVASENQATAKTIQVILSGPTLRVYTSTDRIGVELGGALKNIIAIAAGVVEGLSLGNNARAALISRGIAEITRLGVALGAKPETFTGLSGVGDLIVTCTSTESRNHHVGIELAKGRKLEEILSTMNHVAEGVLTSKSARALAQKHGIEMPITEEVYQVLFEGKPAPQAIQELMERTPGSEAA